MSRAPGSALAVALQPWRQGRRVKGRVEYRRAPDSGTKAWAYARWLEDVNRALVRHGWPPLFGGRASDEEQAPCHVVDAICEELGLSRP